MGCGLVYTHIHTHPISFLIVLWLLLRFVIVSTRNAQSKYTIEKICCYYNPQ